MKISFILRIAHSNQVKLAQIRETHCRLEKTRPWHQIVWQSRSRGSKIQNSETCWYVTFYRRKFSHLQFKNNDGNKGPLLRLERNIFRSEIEGQNQTPKHVVDVAPKQVKELQQIRKSENKINKRLHFENLPMIFCFKKVVPFYSNTIMWMSF